MKPTSRETYKIVRAMLEMKLFTQKAISQEEKVTFSLVNRVVNRFVDMGYVRKRKGEYELVFPAAVLNLFPIYRQLRPYAVLDIDMDRTTLLGMIKGKGVLCLTSALPYYDDYFRDPGFHVYLDDPGIIEELRGFGKGYCHVELYQMDLDTKDFVKSKGQLITSRIRTIIDLFCSNKAYAAERLVKKEWTL